MDLSAVSAEHFTAELARVSCLLISGHGIEPGLVDAMRNVSIEFFSLPSGTKEKVRWPGTGVWHGWMPDGGATELDETATPDLVEWYQVNELDSFELWPTRPARLRDIWTEYYRACSGLATRMMLMVADALDLPDDELGAWTDRQYANLAVNHYPPLEESPKPGQVRLSTHTDECGITILTANDAPGGLEVRIPGTGQWTPVHIPPGAFLVQVGDLLARWTNRVIRANVHRVVNPPVELLGSPSTQRDTIVFFHLPALDTKVVPAPSCVARSGRPALPPLDAFDFVISRQKTYVSAVPVNVDLEV